MPDRDHITPLRSGDSIRLTPTREDTTRFIAGHPNVSVTDDGEAWHILIPWYDSQKQVSGHKTFTAHNMTEIRSILGY